MVFIFHQIDEYETADIYEECEQKSRLIAKWPLCVFIFNCNVLLLVTAIKTIIFDVIWGQSESKDWFMIYNLG